ncbi:MAG TPA: hypothetical protein VFQ44_08850 [Streptosporangiaceae bacterium]|nr:hypothetical protein [Streptosporangiaceae bacterium]
MKPCERIDAPLEVRSGEHLAELFLNDIARVLQEMMPELVRESEPGPGCWVIGVNDQQRRLAVVRAQPVASFAEGTEYDIGGEVHLNNRWKVPYLGYAQLEVAAYLFGKDPPTVLVRCAHAGSPDRASKITPACRAQMASGSSLAACLTAKVPVGVITCQLRLISLDTTATNGSRLVRPGRRS